MSVLMSILKERVHVYPHLPYIYAIYRLLDHNRRTGVHQVAQLTLVIFALGIILNAFRRCSRIDVMFDTYRDISIKSGERKEKRCFFPFI